MNIDAKFIVAETTLIPSDIYSSIVKSLQADHTRNRLKTTNAELSLQRSLKHRSDLTVFSLVCPLE